MLFKLSKLIKKYDGKEIINIESLSIESGGVIGIAGPNGSGKTTFLEMLSSLQTPTSGDIYVNDEHVGDKASDCVIMVLQNPVMFNMSVFENIAFGLRAKKLNSKEITSRVDREIDLLGLRPFRDRNAKSLSGGEKQKVAIARATILNPDVLILDEPTSGLDFHARASLQELIHKLYEMNPDRTILVASHDRDFLHTVSLRTYVIVEKKLLFESVENFYRVEIIDKTKARVGDSTEIYLIAEELGDANIIIPPESIVLSDDSLNTSMRNSLQGVVTKITHDNNKDILIWMNVGFEVCCKITHASYKKMGIHIGDKLWASFKATSIKLFY